MGNKLNTSDQYDKEIFICRELFLKKMKDYGTAWRILRHSSITDQLFIKAQRIRSIQEKGVSKVDEDIQGEFIGIINYSVIGLIQLELGISVENTMDEQFTMALYDKYIKTAKDLMSNKNHDYGEAWRDMRVSSITDLILMKIKTTLLSLNISEPFTKFKLSFCIKNSPIPISLKNKCFPTWKIY